jgi:hypothetical protein
MTAIYHNYEKLEFMEKLLVKAVTAGNITFIKKNLDNYENDETICMIRYCNIEDKKYFFENEELSKKLHFQSSIRRFKNLEMIHHYLNYRLIYIIIFGKEEDYIEIIDSCPNYKEEINRTILWIFVEDCEGSNKFLNLLYDIVGFYPTLPKPAKR